MTQQMEEMLKMMPEEMRERILAMDPAQREKVLERSRQAIGSMDDRAREAMREHRDQMQKRPPAPEVGSEAPDFDLAVLDADGRRVRLRDLRGKPVGLIFGSYT